MNYEQAIKELQDTVTVVAHLERQQSAMLKDHAQMLRDHDSHLGEIAEYRRRTEQNLAEITDRLNGLIGFVDGMQRPSQPS
jgi:calcineurin-like phosphoesterase family protein